MSRPPYRVKAHHLGLPLTEAVKCATWQAALAVARRLHAEHPQGDVVVWNVDRCDVDDNGSFRDGLEESERDSLTEAGVYV